MLPSEADIVRECRAYLDLCRYAKSLEYRIIHIPIPGKGTWKQNAHSVSMAGHADCEVYLPGGGVLHIEFKNAIGKMSPQQMQWRDDLKGIGHKYFVIRSFTELKAVLHANGVHHHFWKNGEICQD